jgi:type IV pilus assembly protein PilB
MSFAAQEIVTHYAIVRSEPPSERLREYYRDYGGGDTFADWIPFGHLGPVLMVAHPEGDPSVIKLPSALFVPFQISGNEYQTLRSYWLDDRARQNTSKIQAGSLDMPDFRSMDSMEVLRWLVARCPMNDNEREECFADPGVSGLPDGLGKGLRAVIAALRCGLPPVDLSHLSLDLRNHALISDAVRDQHPSVAFSSDSSFHYVAVANPDYTYAIENEVAANDDGSLRECRFFIAPREDIEVSSETRKLESRSVVEMATDSGALGEIRANETVDLTIPDSILKLNLRGREVEPESVLHKILAQGSELDASDIHFEPIGSTGRIRLRVDGRLHTYMRPEHFKGDLFYRVVTVGKDTSGLSATDVHKPDDSKFKFSFRRSTFQVRANSIPLDGGVTKLVFRLQRKGAQLQTMEFLKFPEQTLNAFKSVIQARQGMVLVTGPTGSGKTTTLYSLLNEINRPDINIQTIEDPVEKTIQGINQASLDEERGSSFEILLKAILRQDPDVILVGELRDAVTVKTCIQAAQTGHMVFSTLHTNSAAEAFDRLAVQAADPFVLARSITLVQAQRLVRCLCPHCRREVPITEGERAALQYFHVDVQPDAKVFVPGECDRCIGGYRGRRVVSEVVVVDDHIRDIICRGNTAEGTIAARIREYCHQNGFQTYLQDAFRMAIEGVTSIAEALDFSTAIDRYRFEQIVKTHRQRKKA